MKYFIYICLLFFIFSTSRSVGVQNFVTVNGSHFEINHKSYYFIGTNFWYGAILGSTGEGGDRARLLKELDRMKELGITNLRILAGAEGPDNEPFRVTPALLIAPGKYNEQLLDGLDFLLSEMKKRGQYAILYLQNSWDWSGGYAQYLNWNGYGPIPYPSVKPHTWSEFMKYAGQFHTCDNCKEQFREHLRFMISRINKYTGLKYTDDPVIMTWEIGNEPRAFGNENIRPFKIWLRETSAFIKSLDKNHLVTTGTEGQHGSEGSLELFKDIHADPNIDYLTMHIWPKNWSWLNTKDIPGSMDQSIINTNKYMDDHIRIARELNKPLVLEEFGLPRDQHGYSASESTTCRDKYYRNAFQHVIQNAKNKGVLAGANFWSWGGFARPIPGQTYWKKGDDYLGDPPVEEQGLNSVFDTDTTIPIIRKYNQELKKILK